MSHPLVQYFLDPRINLSNKTVYFDTSIIYELCVQSVQADRQRQVGLFLERMFEENAIMVTSVKVWEELMIRLTNSRLNAVYPTSALNGPKISDKKIIAANPGIMGSVVQVYDKMYQSFGNLNNHILVPDIISIEMTQNANVIQQRDDLKYPDALHCSIVNTEGINYLATLDGDITRVTNATFGVLTDYQTYTNCSAMDKL